MPLVAYQVVNVNSTCRCIHPRNRKYVVSKVNSNAVSNVNVKLTFTLRLAKQERLIPPGHLASPLVCKDRECPLWCYIVGATVTVHQFFVFYI